MISFISNLEEGWGIGNYATQLYRHLEEISDEIEQVKVGSTSLSFAPRIFNEFFYLPKAYYFSRGDVAYLPNMNYAALSFLPMTKKTVLTCHDIAPIVTDFEPWISQKFMKLQARAMKRADKIIAISEHTKNDLIEHLDISAEKIEVIYQGVDTEFFEPKERDEEVLSKYGLEGNYLLFVGTEKERKNLGKTLRIFAEILEERPDLKLVKVGRIGRKEYREKHLKTIEELGIEENVIFTGFVEQEELPQIYSSAEALLLLSKYEGFGRPPLEAMACGTPPIVSNKTSLPEVVGDCGLKLHEYKNQKAASDILKFLEKSTEESALISRAEEFEWENTAKKTLYLLNNV